MKIEVRNNWLLAEFIKITHDRIALPSTAENPSGQDLAKLRVIAKGEGKVLPNGTLVPITSCEVGDEIVLMGGRVIGLKPNWMYSIPEDKNYVFVEADSVIGVVKREPADDMVIPTAKQRKLILEGTHA